jgi:hypothetical protein
MFVRRIGLLDGRLPHEAVAHQVDLPTVVDALDSEQLERRVPFGDLGTVALRLEQP